MQTRRENNMKDMVVICEKNIPQRLITIELLETENIVGLQTESGIQICRISPKVQKLKEIKNSFNAKVVAFCFDPHGKRLAYSLTSHKFLIFNIDSDTEMTFQIFKNLGSAVLSLSWLKLSIQADCNANPFKVPLYPDDFEKGLTERHAEVRYAILFISS